MQKLSVLVLATLVLTAASAAAQGPPPPQPPPEGALNLEMRQPATMSPDAVRSSLRPFAKQAFMTKEAVVQATRDCLKKDLFFVSCREMVVRANELFKLGIDKDELRSTATTLQIQAGLDKFADYLMTTVVTDVPQEGRRGKLDAAKSDGTIAEGAIRRIAVPNEPGLYDTTAGRWVLSLLCSNFIVDWGNYYTLASGPGSGGIIATGTRLAREAGRDDQRRALADAGRSSSHGNFFSLDRGTGKAFWFGVLPAVIVGSAIAYHGWASGDMTQCYAPGSTSMICQS